MSVDRYFLGWGRPALHLTTEYLFETFHRDGDWDLSGLLLVVPGGRAKRRLLELLALRAETAAAAGRRPLLHPPHIVTPGQLPEELYTPALPLASDLEAGLARAAVLRRASPEAVGLLFSRPPEQQDLPGWLRLADEIGRLDQELAGACVPCEAVETYCRARGLEASCRRWGVLKQLRQDYRAALHEAGLLCRMAARETALAAGAGLACPPPDGRGFAVILVATADLPAVAARLLEAGRCAVTALVHAPAAYGDGFDAFGVLLPAYWSEREVPLQEEDVCIVNTSHDQASEVRRLLQAAPDLSASQVTIGVGDDAFGAVVQRVLDQDGRATHRAVSGTLGESAPGRLLSALTLYARSPRAENFAALVRHPDLAAALDVEPDAPDAFSPDAFSPDAFSPDAFSPDAFSPEPGAAFHALAERCDAYRNRHLPTVVTSGAAQLPDALERAAAALSALLAVPGPAARPLCDWAEPAAALLAGIYEPLLAHGFQEKSAARRNIERALEAFGAALQELRLLDQGHGFVQACGFVEALEFILARFGATALPDERRDSAIDVVGWLEIHLDDAPVAIVTGFNEGSIPASVTAAPFLPDGLCRELGLLDNARRYARDAYLLQAITASRPGVVFVSARRTAQNEPLAPSRLFFACAPDKVAARALAFYAPPEEPGPAAPALAHGPANALARIPRPRRLARPLAALPVTAFRDYLACPYRFYLQHVLELRPTDDGSIEMGGDLFGGLAHSVLQDYGTEVLRLGGFAPREAAAIEEILLGSLERRKARRFNDATLPVVSLQCSHLERRLQAFARWQAGAENHAWQTVEIEAERTRTLVLGDAEFTIHGRMDRIDRHIVTGEFRILDYKTSESGAPPAKTHGGAGAWKDLQLPLYRCLAHDLHPDPACIQMGYLVLSGDTARVKLEMAPWDAAELADAERCAHDVMRHIRENRFWPPSEALPAFEDGLDAICQDAAANRLELFAGNDAPFVHWPDSVYPFAAETARAPEAAPVH